MDQPASAQLDGLSLGGERHVPLETLDDDRAGRRVLRELGVLVEGEDDDSGTIRGEHGSRCSGARLDDDGLSQVWDDVHPLMMPASLPAHDPTRYALGQTGDAGSTDAKDYAKQALGGNTLQFQCLERLWNGESNWNPHATNPSSGAYGIPQALPATKLATAGADWRDNAVTQVKWGLSYIGERYGTPCDAWAFWQSNNPHWY